MHQPIINPSSSLYRDPWRRANGFVHLMALDAVYCMSSLLFDRITKHSPSIDAWVCIELGAEVNEFRWIKLTVAHELG